MPKADCPVRSIRTRLSLSPGKTESNANCHRQFGGRPFAKTGGLADVATALATALTDLGHSVWLVLPHYPQVDEPQSARPTESPSSRRASTSMFRSERGTCRGGVLRAQLPGSAVTVLLIDQPAYYDRPGLYQSGGSDFRDNCERFVFFSRAVTTLAQQLRLRPDVIHANDWQTGLIPALLAIEGRKPEHFGELRLGLHDPQHGLSGPVLALGHAADRARLEVLQLATNGVLQPAQLAEDGHRLLRLGDHGQPHVRARNSNARVRLWPRQRSCVRAGKTWSASLNGVETKIWNPQTDPALPANYSIADLEEGKRACKRRLQEEFGLPMRDDVPLFAMVTRLTDQKGLDLVTQAAETILRARRATVRAGKRRGEVRELV